MNGYVWQALKELGHILTSEHIFGPLKAPVKHYRQRCQMAYTDTSLLLDAAAIKYIERVVGKFLFYARVIDNTMLHGLSDIASAMSKGTEKTMDDVVHFLNYCASNSDAELCYCASEMILQGDSDGAYLVNPGTRSRTTGYHFYGNLNRLLINAPRLVISEGVPRII